MPRSRSGGGGAHGRRRRRFSAPRRRRASRTEEDRRVRLGHDAVRRFKLLRRATIALGLIVHGPAASSAGAADLAYERAVDTAFASRILPAEIVETAKNGCATALCFAQALAADLPGLVRLEPVTHPDTDSIRWATTKPSVVVEPSGGTRMLTITRFGRKAIAELRAALASAADSSAIALDIAGNRGGDFERMLQIAGLLIGSRRDAIAIDHGDRVEHRSLQGPADRSWEIARVRTDDKTASAARLLACLLDTHTDATIDGPPPCERPVLLKRRITVDHDWRLVLPVAALRVTGR